MMISAMNRVISVVFSRAMTCNKLNSVAAPLRGLSSGRRPDDDEARITLTDDGTTIVCWHPEKQFPYEHSLPYDEVEDRSVLKFKNVVKGENIYYKGETNLKSMEELQAITYTSKHVWRRRRFDGLQMRPDHPRKGV